MTLEYIAGNKRFIDCTRTASDLVSEIAGKSDELFKIMNGGGYLSQTHVNRLLTASATLDALIMEYQTENEDSPI